MSNLELKLTRVVREDMEGKKYRHHLEPFAEGDVLVVGNEHYRIDRAPAMPARSAEVSHDIKCARWLAHVWLGLPHGEMKDFGIKSIADPRRTMARAFMELETRPVDARVAGFLQLISTMYEDYDDYRGDSIRTAIREVLLDLSNKADDIIAAMQPTGQQENKP